MDGANEKIFDLLLKQNAEIFRQLGEVKDGLSALTTKVTLYESQVIAYEKRLVSVDAELDEDGKLKTKLKEHSNKLGKLEGVMFIAGRVRDIIYTAIAIGAVMLALAAVDVVKILDRVRV